MRGGQRQVPEVPQSAPPIHLSHVHTSPSVRFVVGAVWGTCTEAHKYVMLGSFFTAHGEGQRFTGKTRKSLGIGDNLVRFHNFNVSMRSCEDSMTESLIFKGQLLGKGFPLLFRFLEIKKLLK